jgi:hypothetical protein
MARSSRLARFVRMQLRFLAFRSAPIAAADRGAFLGLALVFTWIAGLGRYWDHGDPLWWQRWGLGSLAYVFAMAALLWLVGAPLRLRAWRYLDVLLFVAFTSPLAWAYAIPVDRWMSVDDAAATNAWFLAVVATWRVALLLRQLKVVAGMPWWMAVTTGLLPLVSIVVALTLWELQHVTFNLMAESDFVESAPEVRPPAEEVMSTVVMILVVASFFLAPWLAMIYAAAVVTRRAPESP